MVISYLYWRYWQVGTDTFRRIVSRDIIYSEASNVCKLDIYHPDGNKMACNDGEDSMKKPAIIFIYGGSWSSGQKLLYTSMANTLRESGYVVVVPDYRKYPAGHSAGAHLASQVVLCDLVEKVKHASLATKKQTDRTGDSMPKNHTTDFLPQVEGLLLFAGVYDIETHYEHEAARGVEKISAMGRVMGLTSNNYRKNSPLNLIETHGSLFDHSDALLEFAPRILFVHGEKDITVPLEQSTNMYNMLGKVLPPPRRDDVDVRIRLYRKMKHSHCVTALMPSIFGTDKMHKPLIRDITAFVDAPLSDERDH
ncbi:Alpha/Beta hydrolase protein [Absidia repens]|uniref:Alpha/Beta hydrolase protein n=1 Tax=Absidia repens TaxID=90262 RepID=A0A1X2ITW5_9FUNG|nr:Alpha/Beta hydrolase protein [Absidia repens]